MSAPALKNLHRNLHRSLRNKFNAEVIKTRGLTLLIEHSPCCILAFGAGLMGVSFLNHNPMLELGFALGGALIGEHIGHKLFSKNHTHGAGIKPKIKRYGLALVFGLASWGVHQAFFHDNKDHGDHAHINEQAYPLNITECDGHDHTSQPSFEANALKVLKENRHTHTHLMCH